MGMSLHVGRIGALAVALGIGAAVATGGHGVAWADTSSSDTAASGETPAKDSPATSSGPSGQAPTSTVGGTGAGQVSAGGATRSAGSPAAPGVKKPKRWPGPGVAISSGGALTSSRVTGAGPDRKPRIGVRKPAGTGSAPTPDTDPKPQPEPETTTGDGTAPTPEPDTTRAAPVAVAPKPARTGTRAPAPEWRPKVTAAEPAPVRATTVVGAIRDAVDRAGDVARRVVDAPASAPATFTPPPATDIAPISKTPPATTPLVAQTIPDPPAAQPTTRTVVTGLLAAVGIAPLATGTPLTPAQPPAAWALLAWARREFERGFGRSGTPVTSVATTVPVATAMATEAVPTAAVAAAPTVGTTRSLGWITGPGITSGFNIGGTDLGIMWDDGNGNILTIFGDTFREPAMVNDWRSNVLLRSSTRDLSNGMTFDAAVVGSGIWSAQGPAVQVIKDPGFLGLFGSTTTIIPTAGISVTDDQGNTTQYVNFMSVRTWDSPGRWTTNYSAIAYSTDGGQTWQVDPGTVRSSGWLRASSSYQPGNQNFQQGAYTYGDPDDANSYNAQGVPYIYSYGTPSGRGGSAYLSRVPEDRILQQGEYEYWNGSTWVKGDPSAAVPVIGATDQSAPLPGVFGWIQKIVTDFLGGIVVGGLTGGNVSEMSVQYNQYLDQYVVLYTDGSNNVVMRTADSPQGEWSEPTTLATSAQYPGLYAPMIHPWSGTANAGEGNEQYLYWNLSQWTPYYNVRFMETDLEPTRQQQNVVLV